MNGNGKICLTDWMNWWAHSISHSHTKFGDLRTTIHKTYSTLNSEQRHKSMKTDILIKKTCTHTSRTYLNDSPQASNGRMESVQWAEKSFGMNGICQIVGCLGLRTVHSYGICRRCFHLEQTKCKESRIIGLYPKWQYLHEYNHFELSHAIHDQHQMNGKEEKKTNIESTLTTRYEEKETLV